MLLPTKADGNNELLPNVSAEKSKSNNSLAYMLASATLNSLERSLNDIKENLQHAYYLINENQNCQNLVLKEVDANLSNALLATPLNVQSTLENIKKNLAEKSLKNARNAPCGDPFYRFPINLDSIVLIEKKINCLREFHHQNIKRLFGIGSQNGACVDEHRHHHHNKLSKYKFKHKSINYLKNISCSSDSLLTTYKQEVFRGEHRHEYGDNKAQKSTKECEFSTAKAMDMLRRYDDECGLSAGDTTKDKPCDGGAPSNDTEEKTIQKVDAQPGDDAENEGGEEECSSSDKPFSETEDHESIMDSTSTSDSTANSTNHFFHWPSIQNCIVKHSLMKYAGRKPLSVAMTNVPSMPEESAAVLQSPTCSGQALLGANKCMKAQKSRERKKWGISKHSTRRKNVSDKQKKTVHWAQDLYQVHYFNEDDKVNEFKNSLQKAKEQQDICLYPWSNNNNNNNKTNRPLQTISESENEF